MGAQRGGSKYDSNTIILVLERIRRCACRVLLVLGVLVVVRVKMDRKQVQGCCAHQLRKHSTYRFSIIDGIEKEPRNEIKLNSVNEVMKYTEKGTIVACTRSNGTISISLAE